MILLSNIEAATVLLFMHSSPALLSSPATVHLLRIKQLKQTVVKIQLTSERNSVPVGMHKVSNPNPVN